LAIFFLVVSCYLPLPRFFSFDIIADVMSKVNHRTSGKKYPSRHTPKSHMQNFELNWNDGTFIGGLERRIEKIRQRRKARRVAKQREL